MQDRFINREKKVFPLDKKLEFVVEYILQAQDAGWGMEGNNPHDLTTEGFEVNFVKFSEQKESLDPNLDLFVAADLTFRSLHKPKERGNKLQNIKGMVTERSG